MMQAEQSTIVKLTFKHITSAHAYFVDEILADRIQEFFIEERKEDVVASYIEPTTPQEQRAYKAFNAQSQSLKWLDALQNLGFKLVPAPAEKNAPVSMAQPKESALMMALYHLEAEDLRKNVKSIEPKKSWGIKAG